VSPVTAQAPPPVTRVAPVAPVTQTTVIRSEWIKLRSLRSTVVVSALTVVVMIAYPLLLAGNHTINPIDRSLFGVHIAWLTSGILGVLVITGEYSTGVIQATLCAVPRRLPVLWAKGLVFAGAVFTVSLAASFAAFEVGQARYGGQGVSLAAPGALRAVFGAALFLTGMGLFGLGFGFLTRSTGGGIVALLAFGWVLPEAYVVLPGSWQVHVAPYLPVEAGEAMYETAPYPRYARALLSAWPGFALFCGYLAVTIAAAAIVLRRRDATSSLRWRDRAREAARTGMTLFKSPGRPENAPAPGEPDARLLARVSIGPVTQAGVIRSEWLKFRSVRSIVIVLTIAAALIVGTGLLVAADTDFVGMTAAARASFDPIGQSLLGAHNFAWLLTGILGVLAITGEYTTGMIRATFGAVPRRLPVLWAKAAVLASVVFAVTLASSFAAFLGGQAIFGAHGVSLASAGALRAVFGSALCLTVMALFGLGLGFLTRNTAGGIAAVFGLTVILTDSLLALPAGWQPDIVPYLPLQAGLAVMSTQPSVDGMLQPWPGFAVFCGYAAAAIAAAALTLRRRDA
jgi:ABC-2 type transport system permease protein